MQIIPQELKDIYSPKSFVGQKGTRHPKYLRPIHICFVLSYSVSIDLSDWYYKLKTQIIPQYLILKSKNEKGRLQHFNYLHKFKSALKYHLQSILNNVSYF